MNLDGNLENHEKQLSQYKVNRYSPQCQLFTLATTSEAFDSFSFPNAWNSD